MAELQRLFALEADGVNLGLDLYEVELMDREAVRFLARCEGSTSRLRADRPIAAWMARERDQQ